MDRAVRQLVLISMVVWPVTSCAVLHAEPTEPPESDVDTHCLGPMPVPELPCLSPDSVYPAIKERLSSALGADWRVKETSAKKRKPSDAGIELLGPMRKSGCERGTDVSEFMCIRSHGPVRYLVRLEEKASYRCPDRAQSGNSEAGRIPTLESRCFYIFLYHPAGGQQPNLGWNELYGTLANVLEAGIPQLSCPGR